MYVYAYTVRSVEPPLRLSLPLLQLSRALLRMLGTDERKPQLSLGWLLLHGTTGNWGSRM